MTNSNWNLYLSHWESSLCCNNKLAIVCKSISTNTFVRVGRASPCWFLSHRCMMTFNSCLSWGLACANNWISSTARLSFFPSSFHRMCGMRWTATIILDSSLEWAKTSWCCSGVVEPTAKQSEKDNVNLIFYYYSIVHTLAADTKSRTLGCV